ncbi:MAG: hypothetical protein R3F42_12250 [Pseudomonadota bacterium]
MESAALVDELTGLFAPMPPALEKVAGAALMKSALAGRVTRLSSSR